MKKILILNQGKTQNIGDIAINSVMTHFFNRNFEVENQLYWDENMVFGMGYRSNLIKKVIKRLMKYNFFGDFFMKRYIKKNYKKKVYDAIVIGGGDLLSGHSGFCCAFYNWVEYFSKKNTKICVIGISTNKNMEINKKNKYIEAIKKCTYISARDKFSWNIINNEYNLKCDLHKDVVFSYNKIFMNNENVDRIQRNVAVVVPIKCSENILGYMKLKNKLEYFKHIESKIMESKINEIIITTTVEDDKNTAKELNEYLINNSIIKVTYKDIYDINEYINIIKKSKLVISGRMHAMILGLIYKNDVSVIRSNIKLKTFSEEYENNYNIDEAITDSLVGLEKVSNIISGMER